MKKRSNKSVSKRKSEFRYHTVIVRYTRGKYKKIRHPSYIWRQRGNMYDYHSITHSNHVEGIELREMRSNPNPKDKRKAYYDINSKTDIKSSFGRKRKGWKLHPLDQTDIHNKK